MIAIVDYGMGNLRSVQKAVEHVGSKALVTAKTEEILAADGLILPGVGAFGDAMASLHALELVGVIETYAKSGRPLLGICLGMQLLFSVSEEHGEHAGIGLIPGRVRRFAGDFKVPQVGWNQLDIVREHPLLNRISGGDFAYFVHSYYVDPDDKGVIVALTDYHQPVPAVVACQNVYGMQFHPEKSSLAGLNMLANFVEMCPSGVSV